VRRRFALPERRWSQAAPALKRKKAPCGAGLREARAGGGRCLRTRGSPVDSTASADPRGQLDLRANGRSGGLFACATEELVGQPLPALVDPGDRPALDAAIGGLEIADWNSEWIGEGVRASGARFRMALTAAVVRHSDRSVYRVQWSVRDISLRPGPD
jgi:hypothetical protein